MIAIPGGTLLMGSDEFYRDEGPVHEREVAPFELDAHPVTNEEYRRVRRRDRLRDRRRARPRSRRLPRCGPGRPRPRLDGLHPDRRAGRPARLAAVVALAAGRVLARARGTRVVHRRRGCGIPSCTCRSRMPPPTRRGPAGACRPRAEWEWAARGGLVGARFAWGDEEHPQRAPDGQSVAGLVPVPQHGAEGWVGTSPVGTFPPNGYGLLDMTGNTWEWTSDFYAPRHVASRDRRRWTPAAARTCSATPPAGRRAARAQGRLAPVLAGLLPALPPRRALAAVRRHRDDAHRLPLRAMSSAWVRRDRPCDGCRARC